MHIDANNVLTIQNEQPETQLTRIERILDALRQELHKMKLDVSALIASVAGLTTVTQSVLHLIGTMTQNEKDLAQQLADAIAAEDPAAVQAVQDAMNQSATEITARTAELAQAVTDNTTTPPTPPAAPLSSDPVTQSKRANPSAA